MRVRSAIVPLLSGLALSTWFLWHEQYAIIDRPKAPNVLVPSTFAGAVTAASARELAPQDLSGNRGNAVSPGRYSAPEVAATEISGIDPPSAQPAGDVLREAFAALANSDKDSNKAFASSVTAWHQSLGVDEPDPAWSPMAQSQTGSYLASSLGAQIEVVSVRCGGAVCELQAASTSAYNNEQATREWQSTMAAMSRESWFSTYGFAAPNSAIWSAPDGRALMVSYLPRLVDVGGETR